MATDYEARMREIEARQKAEALEQKSRLNSLRNELHTGGSQTSSLAERAAQMKAAADEAVEQQTRAESKSEEAPKDDGDIKSDVVTSESPMPVDEPVPVEQDSVSVDDNYEPEPEPDVSQVHVQEKPLVRQLSSVKPTAKQTMRPSADKQKSRLTSDVTDIKTVRAVYAVAAEIALREFPGVSTGNAISAYIIAHSNERPNVPADLKELVDNYQESNILTDIAEQNDTIDTRIEKLENMVKVLASGMQELELGIAYLIADRKGLTRESANAQLGGKGINMLEDVVPQTMDRMHEQTKQYVNLKRLQDGRRTTPPRK